VTSLLDRPNTALLVIDMQRGVVRNAYDVDRVIANINALVDKARSENVPVIWVQHSDDDLASGSEDWEYVAELAPHDNEPVVRKRYGDSFEETDLKRCLLIARSAVLLSPAHRPTRAFVQHCTARSCADTTRHSSRTRTPPRTCANGVHRWHPIRQLPTRTCTGAGRSRPAEQVER
jgi:Isochorismatase family